MTKRNKSQANAPKEHDLIGFVRSTSEDIASEYRRIQKRATEDPGTAGDQGEENWAELLRNWLSPMYHIVTKGRILGENGNASPQVDVLILHPHYPLSLLNKKLYLAAGVIAAFECKITLKKQYIHDAVENGAIIRRLLPIRTGSPYKELFSPICYGLLAHSHSWKQNPEDQITAHLLEADKKFVQHPREVLDVICVADLAFWRTGKIPWLPEVIGIGSGVSVQYVRASAEVPPVGLLITRILQRISQEDESLRELADYFIKSGIESSTAVGQGRIWPRNIYSERVRKALESDADLGQWGERLYDFM